MMVGLRTGPGDLSTVDDWMDHDLRCGAFQVGGRSHEKPLAKAVVRPIMATPNFTMDILITLLTIVELLVCLLLILIILMQRPRTEGLGAAFGEGVTSQMWGAQTTNVLQKGTSWLAVLLFVLTVTLAALISRQHGSDGKTIFQKPAPTPAAATPPAAPAKTDAAKAPAAPAKPADAPAAPAKAGDAKAPDAKAPAAQVSKQPGGTVVVKPTPASTVPATKPAEAPKPEAPKTEALKAPEAPKAATPPPAPAPATDAKK